MEVILGLLMCGFSFYYFYCKVIYPIQEENAKNTAGKLVSCITYDEKTRVLKLHGFHRHIGKIIKMQRYQILHTGYQPEKTTYTSVTVGNVTTGGVSREEAYKYISGTSNTDKYQLMYVGKEIKRIQLCSDDVKREALQLGLDEYMNRDGEIVVVENRHISREAAQAALAGFYSPMQNEILPGYPDKGKCSRIRDFLCDSGMES